MSLAHPSREFDEAVAAVCHGTGSEDQGRALNELLRRDPSARDQYLLRVELHSRLASEPDLFVNAHDGVDLSSPRGVGALLECGAAPRLREGGPMRGLGWVVALAAAVTVLATGWWLLGERRQGDRVGATSKAVAMLHRTVDAEWAPADAAPRAGAPLEPGRLQLKSGLAQVVLYSGARVAIEGPAELSLVSADEVICRNGRLVAEVPPQARAFRIGTPQIDSANGRAVFGVAVQEGRTELHVFEGSVEFRSATGAGAQTVKEGAGVVTERAGPARFIAADAAAFAALFDVPHKSSHADVLRLEGWRAASSRLDDDPSLLVHFDFEPAEDSDWRLPNTNPRGDAPPDAAIVGCQWVEGRWPDKRALEFSNVSDRVRLSVPGEYESLTLAVWVRVQGLDRKINSLFMSDGFDLGTVHWSVRDDGVLGLTAIGAEPGRYQICASPPVLTLDQFGLWTHLAAVIDGGNKRVVHYLNGLPISEHDLKIDPPFGIGVAELGNWNARDFPKDDSFMIRNFSGAMDEFCLFRRALSAAEILALYSSGQTQAAPLRPSRN